MGSKLTPQELQGRDGVEHISYSAGGIKELKYFGCCGRSDRDEMLRMALTMMDVAGTSKIRIGFPVSRMAIVGIRGASGELAAALVDTDRPFSKSIHRRLRVLVGDPGILECE